MRWILWTLETPPRTWGRPHDEVGEVIGIGNTPTHVGKTDDVEDLLVAYRKHPHARGEDIKLGF